MPKSAIAPLDTRIKSSGLSAMIHPRISKGVSVSIPVTAGSHEFIKPSVAMEIDVPDGMSVEEASTQLEEYLLNELDNMIDNLRAYLGG